MKVYQWGKYYYVTHYDFGDGTITQIPRYKWKGCEHPHQCSFVENGNDPVPQIYDLVTKESYTYTYGAYDQYKPDGMTCRYQQTIQTNRGIKTHEEISRLLIPAVDVQFWDLITVDYHTDMASIMRYSGWRTSRMLHVYTHRGGHIEDVYLNYVVNVDARSYNVIGPSIYIWDNSLSHCDTRVGYLPFRIMDNIWNTRAADSEHDVKFTSRLMGDQIIATCYVQRCFATNRYGVTSAKCMNVCANLLDLRWPAEYAAQYPRIEIDENIPDMGHITIGCY